MASYLLDRIQKLNAIVSDITEHAEELLFQEPPHIMLISMDDDGEYVKDLVVEVYNRTDKTDTLARMDLEDLLRDRLYLQGIDPKASYKPEMASGPTEFQANLLTFMLLKTIAVWKCRYKDMSDDELKGFEFPKKVEMDFVK